MGVKVTHHHRRGIGRLLVPREWGALRAGMRALIERGVVNPKFARNQVIRFTQAEKARIAQGVIGPYRSRNI